MPLYLKIMRHAFHEPKWLQKIHAPSWVVLILAIIFIFRIPSFFEPFYYGDEMIYLNLGEATKRGMVLYRDIHDNKPPLLYLTAAVAGNVFWFRAILAGWMMLTTVAFWRLCTALFIKNQWIVKSSVVAFAILTTLPLLEGQCANAELFMIGPTILAFYVLLTKKLNAINLFAAGLLLSVSTLFKVPAAFDIGAIIFLWLVTIKLRRKDLTNFVRQNLLLVAGYLLPILVSLVWYYSRGAISEYLIAAYLQNFGYLSSWRAGGAAEPFLVKNGPLLLRGAVLLVGLGVMWFFRNKLTRQFMFVVGWFLFALFAATLSERPYPHYLIQVVPAVSILVGMLLASRSVQQSLVVVPLFVLVIAVIRFQFWYYPSAPYYERFVSYALGESTHEEYFNSFDAATTRNYEIAKFIVTSTHEDDKIFVWGDSPTIYALSKRFPPLKYVATYHINDFSSPVETISAISENKPKLIIVLPNSQSFPELEAFIRNYYIEIEKIDGAGIWMFSNSLSLL